MFCGQAGRWCNSCAGHWCSGKLCNAYPGATAARVQVTDAISITSKACYIDLGCLAADLDGKAHAICCIPTPDCSHGLSRAREWLQVLWRSQHQLWARPMAELARLPGRTWHCHAASGCLRLCVYALHISSRCLHFGFPLPNPLTLPLL